MIWIKFKVINSKRKMNKNNVLYASINLCKNRKFENCLAIMNITKHVQIPGQFKIPCVLYVKEILSK